MVWLNVLYDIFFAGGGPSCLPKVYHTVIELPSRKRLPLKRSPLGWKSLFSRGNSGSTGLRKSSSTNSAKRKPSAPCETTFRSAVSYPLVFYFSIIFRMNQASNILLKLIFLFCVHLVGTCKDYRFRGENSLKNRKKCRISHLRCW